MKGGKDEDQLMVPLFPRLCVNDTEKGGPRAPPRNKMSLYEQFSIPSEKFNSESASNVPLPSNNGINLVPSASSSYGGGQRRCNSPVPPHLAERLHSYSSDGVNLNTLLANPEQRPMKSTNYQTLNATGKLSLTAKCNSFQPHNFSNSNNSSVEKLEDEDDFRVSTFTQSGITPNCSNGPHNMEKEKLTPLNPNYSTQFVTACCKQRKGAATTDLNSRQHVRNQTEEVQIMSHASQDLAERSPSIPSTSDKILAYSSSSPSTIDKISKPLKRVQASLNQENRSSLVDDFSRLHDTSVQSHQECRALRENNALRDSVSVEHCHEDKGCGSLQVGDVDRNDDVSGTSMVDSISGLDISPNDALGIIGQKHFWKVRRAIVNQQRAFSVQVFELHRLIKVQRLIAESPDLLFETNLYLGKPSLKVSPVKKVPSEYVLEPPPMVVKPKDDSEKPNPCTDCTAENAVGMPHSPSLNNDTNKGLVPQRSNCKPYLGNPPPASMVTDIKQAPWCFHPPPGNQWLVPAMSPSKGFVYKPYTGPCPPTPGFMAPVYGSCGPMNPTPMHGNFVNTVHGVLASHQGIGNLPGTSPLGQTYFPPYGMPVNIPSISGSVVKKMSPFARAPSNIQENQLPMGSIDFTIPYQSSCNMSSQKSRVISCCVEKFQPSKESELQGSTASSRPSERVEADALPLFPMAPTVQVSDRPSRTHSSAQQARLIKVVPHNPRSATESAARIFQSILEEREQHD